jgi:hypothetical protein
VIARLLSDNLEKVLKPILKGIRAKKAKTKARALLSFGEGGILVQFNGNSIVCNAKVVEEGACALNPFILLDVVRTAGGEEVLFQVNESEIRFANAKFSHTYFHATLTDKEDALHRWDKYLEKKVERKRQKLEMEQDYRRSLDQYSLLEFRSIVSFKRTDGGIEREAHILKIEAGDKGNRRMLVKTSDFQEIWIREPEIVSIGRGPDLFERH